MTTDLYAQSKLHVTPHARDRFWFLPDPRLYGVHAPLFIGSVGYSRWQRGFYNRRRDCDFLGMELVTAGNVLFTQQGNRTLVEKDTVFVKYPGLAHEYGPGPAGYAHKRFVTIHGPQLHAVLKDLALPQTHVIGLHTPHAFIPLHKKAIGLCTGPPPLVYKDSASLAFRFMMLLCDAADAPAYPLALNAALEYIRRHLDTRMTVGTLAKTAGMSVSHFYRLFTSYLQQPPMAYVRRMKVQRAQYILLHTRSSVKSVAHTLGFDNTRYFSTVFRAYTGMSPTQYRASQT
jgi:AraC-like DNA-binding protein